MRTTYKIETNAGGMSTGNLEVNIVHKKEHGHLTTKTESETET